jgi:hypothetical protein
VLVGVAVLGAPVGARGVDVAEQVGLGALLTDRDGVEGQVQSLSGFLSRDGFAGACRSCQKDRAAGSQELDEFALELVDNSKLLHLLVIGEDDGERGCLEALQFGLEVGLASDQLADEALERGDGVLLDIELGLDNFGDGLPLRVHHLGDDGPDFLLVGAGAGQQLGHQPGPVIFRRLGLGDRFRGVSEHVLDGV